MIKKRDINPRTGVQYQSLTEHGHDPVSNSLIGTKYAVVDPEISNKITLPSIKVL